MLIILKAVFILLGLFLFVSLLFRRMDKHGRTMRKTTYLLFIVLAFLFFRGMGDHGLLDPIEGINASVALDMAINRNFAVPTVDGRLYLGNSMGFWWLSALFLSVFGWSEFSVRLWSVIGGLGMAAAGWFIALRTCGERTANPAAERSANYAAVFIGSSVLVYVTSQLASPHALYAFCVTMSLMGAIYAFRDRRFFILLHVSAILAFVVYGPSGIVLPWLSLFIYAILTRHERFFAKALFYLPGLASTLLVGGGYIVFLKNHNPYILTLMSHNLPCEIFNSTASALFFLASGFILWLGVLPGAVRSAFPLRWKSTLPGEKQNILLLVWSVVFLFFGAFSGDALLLVAAVPSIAVLCANHLASAVERENWRLFQKFVVLEMMLLTVFIFVGLPLFFVFFESLRHTLMSVIPWAVFCHLFLWVGWRYAATRQPRKLMLFMSLISLLSLLPLAGVFDLLAERFSARYAGIYLRNEMKPDDVLVQYASNFPSLAFYIGMPGRSSLLIHVAANQRIVGQSVMGDTDLNNIWLGENRVFMLISRHQRILNPLPPVIYELHRTNAVVLSNQRDRELPSVPEAVFQ